MVSKLSGRLEPGQSHLGPATLVSSSVRALLTTRDDPRPGRRVVAHPSPGLWLFVTGHRKRAGTTVEWEVTRHPLYRGGAAHEPAYHASRPPHHPAAARRSRTPARGAPPGRAPAPLLHPPMRLGLGPPVDGGPPHARPTASGGRPPRRRLERLLPPLQPRPGGLRHAPWLLPAADAGAGAAGGAVRRGPCWGPTAPHEPAHAGDRVAPVPAHPALEARDSSCPALPAPGGAATALAGLQPGAAAALRAGLPAQSGRRSGGPTQRGDGGPSRADAPTGRVGRGRTLRATGVGARGWPLRRHHAVDDAARADCVAGPDRAPPRPP
jgi:hypothetical protein